MKIICDKCKFKNKGNCPDNEFYYCVTCKQNLCLICKPNHYSSHNAVRYNLKNYICLNHNEALIKYCKQCKRNICFACEDHEEHESIFFGELKPNIKEKKEILKEVKSVIDEINRQINEIIEQLIEFSTIINKYYDINKGIIDNYDVKKRNYQKLENIKEIDNNNIIFKKLKQINDEKDIKSKIIDIINLYKKINDNNIIYEINNNINVENNLELLKSQINNIKSDNLSVDNNKITKSNNIQIKNKDNNSNPDNRNKLNDILVSDINNKKKLKQSHVSFQSKMGDGNGDNNKYLHNKQLINSIYIYANDLYIQNKIKSPVYDSNLNDEEFYLVKKKYYSDIKKENNYSQLKNIFIGKIKNIPINDEDLLNIINQFSKEDLNILNNIKEKTVNKINNPTFYEVETILITNPYNISESFMIYQDFKLIEKKCANVLLKDINKIPDYFLTCSFVNNNMIIFHYPKHKFNKQNYICVISKIDEKNNFISEYLLKYNDQNSYEYHIKKLKKQDINNYLQNLSFVNNVAPIVKKGYIEIGIVIKIEDTDSTPPSIPIPIPPIPKIKSTRKNFPFKPLIGLENIGATCYMNATLQCLCNIEKFVDYFKYNEQFNEIIKKDKKNEKLCSSFKTLIENIYPNEQGKRKGSYAPRDFKGKISKMNPLFEGIAANDAKDLVNFLLMTLHSELNKAPENQIQENNNIFQDQRNKNQMFNNFANYFTKSYLSIISDLFYALNYNMTQCSNCKAISYNYQVYFFLIFPLEEVRKFKLSNNTGFNIFNNSFNTNNNEVNIYDCFDYDRKYNIMAGENAMYCNYCKQTCNCTMCTNLATGPEILIIILNRGEGIQFNVKINFSTDLNLANYIELQNTGYQYELFGVITHIGESGMGGHFIAYCKEYWNNQWLKFNDALVSPVNNFKTEVIDFAMPYLLFYQKKK